MGAGNFFSGLLGGYTGTIVKNEARAYNQEMSARELDVKSSLSALDEAVKTGDQHAIQAATSNFERAVNSIREPFQYHRGGGKGKKSQQGEGDPLIQKIVQAMTLHHAQQRLQQPMSEKIPTGPQAGQPAQAVGIPPVPARASSTQASALPEIPSLSSALGALPSIEKQAQTTGRAKSAEVDAEVDSASDWLAKQGINVTPQDKAAMQAHLMGIVPQMASGKVLTGAFTPGTALPADATDIEGHPIPAEGRTKDMAYGTWLAPDGSPHFFSIKPLTLSGEGGSTTQTGIYQTPGGKSIPAFRSPKTGMVVNTAGKALTGGTFVPTAQMPTSSQGTAFQVISGPHGEPQLVQIPVRRMSQKVAPGETPPLPRQPEGMRSFGPKPEPLSQSAKMTIEDLTTARNRLNEVLPVLEKMPNSSSTGILSQSWDKLKSEFYWKQYQAGMAVPEPYETMFSTVSLMSTLMSSQYLHGMRNMIWVNRISAHMPQPTDTPAQMAGKINNINKNIPPLLQQIYKTEQPGIQHAEAEPPKKGPSKGDEREYQGHKYKFNGKVWVRE